MKNKGSGILATVIMIPLIIVVCLLSVNGTKNREGMVSVSVFGSAKLRNEIEIPVAEVDNLEVLYSSKNVKVYPSDEDKIVIKEYLISNNEDAKATVAKQETAEGKQTVTVTGGKTQGINILGMGIGERIEVYLPTEAVESLYLETKSGNIHAEDDFAAKTKALHVQASSGNIDWKNTQAEEIVLETSSGNIIAENMNGNMKAKASSGNVTLEGFSGAGSAMANSGNVRLEVSALTGDLETKTGSGSIKVEIPEETAFTFEAQTGSGNINTDFDDRLSYNKKGNQATGTIGNQPSLKVKAEANSGNIKISYS